MVSVLNKEYPLFTYSSRVLSLAGKHHYHMYCTALSLAIGFYFSAKKSGETVAKRKISLLHRNLNLAVVDEKVVERSLLNKSIHDFEDGLQYYAASESGCTCIVTEDKNDFYFSDLEILSCKEFWGKYVSG